MLQKERNEAISEVMKCLTSSGYEVKKAEDSWQLGPPLPDLIAKKAGKTLLLEVKTYPGERTLTHDVVAVANLESKNYEKLIDSKEVFPVVLGKFKVPEAVVSSSAESGVTIANLKDYSQEEIIRALDNVVMSKPKREIITIKDDLTISENVKSKRRLKGLVKIGVIGCGYWGAQHIRVWDELEEANLTTVCDLEENRLKKVRNKYLYLNTTTNCEDIIHSGVDAVVIATPLNTHYQLAKKALLNNKHALIEKPITANSQEALELIELAKKRNLVLMVGHTYEYHPAVDFLKEAVSRGELGDIYSIDAERLNFGLFRPDVNVLWDLAPHDISIMLSILKDQQPMVVSARVGYHVATEICDVAYIEILFSNGTTGQVHVSWLHPRRIRQITIIGSKKMAVYDDVSESEKIHIYDRGLVFEGVTDDVLSAWPPSYRYGDVITPFIANPEPLKMECSHFIECIVEGKNPRSDGYAGLKVVSILEAADRSISKGGVREKVQIYEGEGVWKGY